MALVDNTLPRAILSLMFDPAILLDLQKAVAPPLTVPPAIERAWLSPRAEQGARIFGAYVEALEAQNEQWRASIAVWAEAHARVLVRNVPRTLSDLEVLDRVADMTSRRARDLRRNVDRDFKRRTRTQRQVAEVDSSAGQVLREHVLRLRKMQEANAEAMERLHDAVRTYRDAVDYRANPMVSSDVRHVHPNSITIAAMGDVRAGIGLKRAGSVAALMAELHAGEA